MPLVLVLLPLYTPVTHHGNPTPPARPQATCQPPSPPHSACVSILHAGHVVACLVALWRRSLWSVCASHQRAWASGWRRCACHTRLWEDKASLGYPLWDTKVVVLCTRLGTQRLWAVMACACRT